MHDQDQALLQWWGQARGKVESARAHPGLRLDKFSFAKEQEDQKKELLQVIKCEGSKLSFPKLRERWQSLLRARGAITWEAACGEPVTLQLSRPSALENAGICLHPVYGFAYLPGSGLKGLARAFAETEWAPAQADYDAAMRDEVEKVFGWADTPERRKRISKHPRQAQREVDESGKEVEVLESSGAVVFYDAWPKEWPRLVLDIVNNHHPDYYGGEDPEPGDWEDPRMVYFLAIPACTTFEFAVGPRDSSTPPELVDRAREWLCGALSTLGVGAKTAAGYGRFEEVPGLSSTWPEDRVYKTKVTLVTPAFLAGPLQSKDDCDLRPATLRGLLRWWWRTLYQDLFDDEKTRGWAKALEDAIWGSTERTGGVALSIRRLGEARVEKFASLRQDPDGPANTFQVISNTMCSAHGLRRPAAAGVRAEGLFYLAYGMHEVRRDKQTKRIVEVLSDRFFCSPGASWEITFFARDTEVVVARNKKGEPDWEKAQEGITAQEALQQARAALWLLRHFGGVGAKWRKGFGSLDDDADSEITLEWCLDQARQLRQHLNLPWNLVDSPWFANNQQLSAEVDLGKIDVWWVLQEAGFALQNFAASWGRDPWRVALGLPRRIGAGRNARGRKQGSKKGQSDLQALAASHPKLGKREADKMRHASPLCLHVGRRVDGSVVFRVVSFPQKYLPDVDTSRDVLQAGVASLKEHMGQEKGRAPRVLPPTDGGPGSGGGSTPEEVASDSSAKGLEEYNQFREWWKTAGIKPGKKDNHTRIMQVVKTIQDPASRAEVRKFLREKFPNRNDTIKEVWDFINSDT